MPPGFDRRPLRHLEWNPRNRSCPGSSLTEAVSGYSIPPHVNIVSVFFLRQPGRPPFGALVAGVVSFEG